ncbi:MAG TPA: phosphoribosyl-AMP cyclohydrolase [Rubricoccaceae bacterium]|jgi:phosphoribosyl-AMP cyclohydrolase
MSFSVSDPQPLLDAARFDDAGLVAAVAQDDATGDVLMLAYMNRDTLRQTLETGVMTYWSRSRQKVWVKGETSGHVQHVRSVAVDCDGDALLFRIEQVGGAACHTGHRTCFYRAPDATGALAETAAPVVSEAELYRSA